MFLWLAKYCSRFRSRGKAFFLEELAGEGIGIPGGNAPFSRRACPPCANPIACGSSAAGKPAG